MVGISVIKQENKQGDEEGFGGVCRWFWKFSLRQGWTENIQVLARGDYLRKRQ